MVAEPGTAQAPASATPPPAVEERFEGYLWLDVEGLPLPFQSDEEIEEFLRTATVESTEKIPVGVTGPRKVVLAGDGVRANTVFKDIERREKGVTKNIAGNRYRFRDWRDSHTYDVAAYHLDRLLGLNRVPPAAPRKIKSKDGSVKIWVEGSITEKERRDRGCSPPDTIRWNQQQQIMRVFDNLVANRDSNLGNLLIDPNWRMWFIDCTRCFGKTESIYFPLKEFEHCERNFWNGLNALDETTARKELSPYLDRGEITSLLTRRDKMLKHFQELIAERGEARVLYDVVPPHDTAPWGE
jgi:hypothetical protein